MKILIDECLPKKLKEELPGHAVFTVYDMGWSGMKNGELLKLMSGEFDVFVTIDQNLQHQHLLERLPISFVILVAVNNTFERLKPLMPEVLEKLPILQLGQVVEIKE